MIVTVQLVRPGSFGSIKSLVRKPDLTGVAGLRSAETMVLAPLAASRPPSISRIGLVAFWDGDDAADEFIEDHPIGRRFAGGVEARLRPLRAHGAWPGLPDDVPGGRAVPHQGPVVVLTLARLKGTQALRFARASRPAEKAALEHPGLVWGTAAVRLPFLATISIWESSEASASYAYAAHTAHSVAMAAQDERPFHREAAFIRFAPIRLDGTLGGANPLDGSTIAC